MDGLSVQPHLIIMLAGNLCCTSCYQELQQLQVASCRGRVQQGPAVLVPANQQAGQLRRWQGLEVAQVPITSLDCCLEHGWEWQLQAARGGLLWSAVWCPCVSAWLPLMLRPEHPRALNVYWISLWCPEKG